MCLKWRIGDLFSFCLPARLRMRRMDGLGYPGKFGQSGGFFEWLNYRFPSW